jgi:mannosyl-3-phosphoglycerate phosphatase
MTPSVPLVVFSDLDGTLLDRRTYSAAAAAEAIALLKHARIPLVFCSSKTRAEIELVQNELGIQDPFVVENGGALFIPNGYFDFEIPYARLSSGYQVVQYGRPYAEVVEGLARASRRAGTPLTGFHDMSVEDVARECDLPLLRARLAKLREYDEPFRMQSAGSGERRKLERALNAEGLGCSAGGRFDHAGAHVDKGLPVRLLTTLYLRSLGQVRTVGLGDADNDVALLRQVEVPVVVRGESGMDSARVQASVPGAAVTRMPGPAGWAESVTAIVAEAVRARGPSPLVAPRRGGR